MEISGIFLFPSFLLFLHFLTNERWNIIENKVKRRVLCHWVPLELLHVASSFIFLVILTHLRVLLTLWNSFCFNYESTSQTGCPLLLFAVTVWKEVPQSVFQIPNLIKPLTIHHRYDKRILQGSEKEGRRKH